MSPEQEIEIRRRHERAGYVTTIATMAIQLIGAKRDEHKPVADAVREAWDIGEAMAVEREARGYAPEFKMAVGMGPMMGPSW